MFTELRFLRLLVVKVRSPWLHSSDFTGLKHFPDTITRVLNEKFDEFARNFAREGNREVIERIDKLAEKVDGLTEKVDGLTITLNNVHRQSAVVSFPLYEPCYCSLLPTTF
jgi:hypothetical protein